MKSGCPISGVYVNGAYKTLISYKGPKITKKAPVYPPLSPIPLGPAPAKSIRKYKLGDTEIGVEQQVGVDCAFHALSNVTQDFRSFYPELVRQIRSDKTASCLPTSREIAVLAASQGYVCIPMLLNPESLEIFEFSAVANYLQQSYGLILGYFPESKLGHYMCIKFINGSWYFIDSQNNDASIYKILTRRTDGNIVDTGTDNLRTVLRSLIAAFRVKDAATFTTFIMPKYGPISDSLHKCMYMNDFNPLESDDLPLLLSDKNLGHSLLNYKPFARVITVANFRQYFNSLFVGYRLQQVASFIIEFWVKNKGPWDVASKISQILRNSDPSTEVTFPRILSTYAEQLKGRGYESFSSFLGDVKGLLRNLMPIGSLNVYCETAEELTCMVEICHIVGVYNNLRNVHDVLQFLLNFSYFVVKKYSTWVPIWVKNLSDLSKVKEDVDFKGALPRSTAEKLLPGSKKCMLARQLDNSTYSDFVSSQIRSTKLRADIFVFPDCLPKI